MYLDKSNCNSFFNKYVNFVDKISSFFKYEDNIRHLLYLIVPAFVLKYGISNESVILKCFESTKIYVSGTEERMVTAYFSRNIKKENNNYYTSKYIVLNEYKKASFTNLIDSIVHEFNHAVNSFNNEIKCDDKIICLRTGVSYMIYDKETLKFLRKSSDVYLEEIINTQQSEEIINIINSFNLLDVENVELSNMLYVLKNEIKNDKYKSNSYSFQSYICKELMQNKTFLPTISKLRFKGFVDNISDLFDDIIGKKGSYNHMCRLLEEIFNLELKYINSKFFKKGYLAIIRKKALEVISIISDYDNKCIYK